MIMHIITLSLLIVVIIILRAIFRPSVSPAVIYALWLLVAVKLFLPVSFFNVEVPSQMIYPVVDYVETEDSAADIPSPDSIFTPADSRPSSVIPLDSEQSAVSPVNTATPAVDTIPPAAEVTEPAAPIIPAESENAVSPSPIEKPARQINWKGLITAAWLMGSAAVTVYFAASWVLFTFKIRRDRKLMDVSSLSKLNGTKVYISKNAGGSCLVGLIPSIYLTPEVAESEDASLVIAHEYTHLIHGDCLWTAVRVAALIVFWWNPLVWAAAILSKQDAELACDHAVISKLDGEATLRYARIIVDAIPRKRLTVGLGSGQIKERILMITKKRKTTVIAAVFTVILAILFTGCSFIGIGRDQTPDFYDEITYDVGLYLRPNERDHMIIVGGTTPYIVGGDVSFYGLTDGDIVSFSASNFVEETYPMRVEIYSISKLADGDISHIDENILNELAERGWINTFMMPDSFHAAYEKAERVYSLFTGYADSDDITFDGQRMYRENVYERATIGEIDTFIELYALCEEVFSEEITDSLVLRYVQPEYRLFIELDGELYRFGGYVSQYSAEYNPVFIPLIENDGVYSVKVQASCIFDGNPIHAEAICKYTVNEAGEIHFTDFTLMEEMLVDIYLDKNPPKEDEPVTEPVTEVAIDLNVDAEKEPDAAFWECIAIYGEPGGYVYNGSLVAPGEGTRYFVFGRPANRWETEIAEYVTYKVVTANNNITSCEIYRNDILLFPAASSYAYKDYIPGGQYETQAYYDGASDGNRIVYQITVEDTAVGISAFVSGTDLGAEYLGVFTYDKTTGELVLDLIDKSTLGEKERTTYTVRGLLQKVDDLVAFTCTDSDDALFTEGSPLIFTTLFNPDDFAERFNEYPEKFLFHHCIFPSESGIYLYFCSRSSENRVNNDFSAYFSMQNGNFSGKLDVKLPEDLEYDTVLPIAATGGGGSGECVFYLKLTKGAEVFYVAFDNIAWGEEAFWDSFEYKGIVPEAEVLKLIETLPSSYGSKYVDGTELYYVDDPRFFVPPGAAQAPSISPWGDDKMLHILDTEEDNPVIYYSRKTADGRYGVIRTELDPVTSEYSNGTVIDILYLDDFNALLTVRFEYKDGETYDVQYRGYAHEIAVNANAIETGKKEVSFVWNHIDTEKSNNNNLARGQFRPTDYYNQIHDSNAEVLFHLKTNGYCYYFCTVGNDFAVYYRSYDNPAWKKFDAKVPEECKYDTAVPLFARVNNEYGNGCQFYLELTNKGHKYYLQFADVYGIGIVDTRIKVTEQIQQIYPGKFVMPTDLSITSLDDWETFNYDGMYKQKCYDLLHMLLSGESGIPEFDGLGISEYKLTRKADVNPYAPILYLDFTVTGNSMPESLPAGKYSKIIDLTYDLYLRDTEPEAPLENSECLSVHELETFFAATWIWNIPDHNTWDTSEVLIPASYLAFKYSQDGKILNLANFKKQLYIQFAIEDIRDLGEGYSEMNTYLDKAVYDPVADRFDYWDTRGSLCAYKVTDITMDGEIAYITVQLFADEYNLLPSHLVRYKMHGNIFLSCEVIKESNNAPYGFRG